jgi:hypothetical protein
VEGLTEHDERTSWIAPLAVLGAWLVVFWAWYAFDMALSIGISRSLGMHATPDQAMSAVARWATLRSGAFCVAFPVASAALLWLAWRVRVWAWSTQRTLTFAAASILAAVLVWYTANRFASIATISVTVGAPGQAGSREYMGNPLGDRLAYVAIPLMLLTTFAVRWWGRWRFHRGRSPVPTPPSTWTARDIRQLWLAILGFEAVLVVGVRGALMTPAELLVLRSIGWVPYAFVMVPCLGAVATIWWFTRRRSHPESSSAPGAAA